MAAEFGEVIGLNVDDDQEFDLCFGDPAAWVGVVHRLTYLAVNNLAIKGSEP